MKKLGWNGRLPNLRLERIPQSHGYLTRPENG